MSAIITSKAVRESILQLRATARMKGQQADEAWLKHADLRAVQGGATCDEANAWRDVARALTVAARKAETLESDFSV